jgi:hypothetical protein
MGFEVSPVFFGPSDRKEKEKAAPPSDPEVQPFGYRFRVPPRPMRARRNLSYW